MKYLIVGMLVFALIVAGCAGQQAPAQQQNAGGEVQQNTPPAGNEQQSPPPPPAPAANNSTQLPQPANNSTQPPPPAPAAEPEVKEFTIVATLWKFTPSASIVCSNYTCVSCSIVLSLKVPRELFSCITVCPRSLVTILCRIVYIGICRSHTL